MDFTTIMALIVMLVLILITVRRLLLGKPNECGFEIEILQTKTEESNNLTRLCPKCKRGILKKILSAFAYTPLKWKVDNKNEKKTRP